MTSPVKVHSAIDPIRIVPLHVPADLLIPLDTAAPAATPHLAYRGGPLLTAVKVVTIYWGRAWTGPPLADLATKIDGFFDFVLTSELIDQLAEYNVAGQTIGHGSHLTSLVITTPVSRPVTTDSDIRQLLLDALDAPEPDLPPADDNTLYFVYLAPGVTLTAGGCRSCQGFCGYHDHIDRQIFYAAMPYPECAGCTGGLTPLDALTSTSSHELCEAITDPVPGSGWYNDANGEIGDLCAWKTRELGGHVVQLEWSNRNNRCD